MRGRAAETHDKISDKPLRTEIDKKDAADQSTTADFLSRLQEKCRRPKPPRRLSVGACAVETYCKISEDLLRKSAGTGLRPKQHRRLCTSLRNRNACQDFTRSAGYTKIRRRNAKAQSEHPDQAWALTPTGSRECGHTVWRL